MRIAALITLLVLAGGTAVAEPKTVTIPDIMPELAVRIQKDTERYRKGDAVITVLDGKGRPIEGASIRAEQVTRDFLFGCNIYMFDRLDTPEQNARYKELFKRVMNYATLPFYWKNFEQERGKPDYERTRNMAAWCKANGITTKGHPLVWACHGAGVPTWLPKDDHAEVKRLMEARVRDIIPRYRGEIGIWDVVNESTHGERFAGMSVYDFTTEPFRWAREVGPSDTLIVNEFDIIGDTKGTGPYYKLIRQMLESGVPVDAVGIQTHMHTGTWPPERITATLDRYGDLGLPLHLTETTILSGRESSEPGAEKQQAAYVERFYRVCFSHPAVKAITWWDFSDAGAWQGVAAGLVRKDMSPKPAYRVLDDLINRQWTTVSDGRTKSDGTHAFRGFAGEYEVRVTAPSGETKTVRAHIAEQGSAKVEIRL